MTTKEALELPKAPSRNELVGDYLTQLNESDAASAQDIAEQIFKDERPLANFQVLIPVAAHQESAQITTALEQYAHQETSEPFSIILSLNSPIDEMDNPAVQASISEVEAAQQKHPHLDLRMAMSFYDEPTIGMIRRDLWNGALLASTYSGAYSSSDQDIIGINHDIDTVSISPRYIRRIQQHYINKHRHYGVHGLSESPLPPSSTMVRHALSPDHPNISKGVAWVDYIYRTANVGYENGLITPFSHYALRGGFQASSTTHETGALLEGIPEVYRIPGTTMQTSPRRYVERLRHGFDAIWTPDSFGVDDDCRLEHTHPDLQMKELESLMLKDQYYENSISFLAYKALDRHVARHNAANALIDPEEDIGTPVERAIEVISDMFSLAHQRICLGMVATSRIVRSDRINQESLRLLEDKSYLRKIVEHYLPAEVDEKPN